MCGIFGVYGVRDAAALTQLGLYSLQHRGQESAGIVDPARFNTRKDLKQDQLGASWRHRFEGLGALSESAVTRACTDSEMAPSADAPAAPAKLGSGTRLLLATPADG